MPVQQANFKLPRLGSSQRVRNRHNRPIASHSGRVFVRAKFLDPLAPKPHRSCARTDEPCWTGICSSSRAWR